jgi:predicted amidohydrolase
LGLAQINPTVGDLDGNLEKVVAFIGKARAMGVDVLTFPEMVITGYPPEDLLLKPSFIERAIERTRDVLPHTDGMTVVVGTVDRDVDLYNAAAVLHDGRWVGTYRKRYLPNYGVFDENRYFMPGTRNPVFVRGGTCRPEACARHLATAGRSGEQVIRGGANGDHCLGLALPRGQGAGPAPHAVHARHRQSRRRVLRQSGRRAG